MGKKWNERNTDKPTGMFVNQEGTYQFEIVNAMDSLGVGPAYAAKYNNEYRQLSFSAKVISEGEMNGKIMSWRYNLKFEKDLSIAAVMRHIQELFNVTIEGDEEEAIDMSPFIGRVFMANPKAREIGNEDNPRTMVKLMWFDPGNPDADYGDFIFDDKIVAANTSAIIQPGSNDASLAYWDIIETAAAKRAEREASGGGSTGGGGSAPSGGDEDDEPLPF